jgi:hypothetical protein
MDRWGLLEGLRNEAEKGSQVHQQGVTESRGAGSASAVAVIDGLGHVLAVLLE